MPRSLFTLQLQDLSHHIVTSILGRGPSLQYTFYMYNTSCKVENRGVDLWTKILIRMGMLLTEGCAVGTFGL